MQANSQGWRARAAGILILLGYFVLFCSLLLFAAAAWRWNRDRLQSRWPMVTAAIQGCRTDEYHPFTREGGGVVYSLRCSLSYEFGGATRVASVSTTSSYSTDVRDQIEIWVQDHRGPAARVTVRVNPTDPSQVVIQDPLPIHQQPTPGDGLSGAVPFGIAGIALTAAGLRMRNRSRRTQFAEGRAT